MRFQTPALTRRFCKILEQYAEKSREWIRVEVKKMFNCSCSFFHYSFCGGGVSYGKISILTNPKLFEIL